MSPHLKLSALKEGRWYEYVIRFVLGGAATALAGLVGSLWGPSWGGLFLAFPAVFCASSTLIEQHERKRKERAGLKGELRGRQAAALDAAGATLGSLGMIGFGAIVWLSALDWKLTLLIASGAWLAISISALRIRRSLRGFGDLSEPVK